MKRTDDIIQRIAGALKMVLLFCCVLLLVSCGGDDELESCGTIQSTTNDYEDPESGATCMLCSFFNILTDNAAIIANNSWSDFAKPLSYVVLVVAAIYVALSTLKMVGSFGKQNIADYLTSDKGGLFILMFKATIIFYLLNDSDQAFQRYILHPVLGVALEIGHTLSSTVMSGYDPTSANGLSEASSWNTIFRSINMTAKHFNDGINSVAALGQTIACYATVGKIWVWKWLQLVYGSILFAFGWILLAAVSFYLADIIIRLTMVAALLPLGIACAVSNLSIAYTKNIWNLFLNVFFNFIILGLVLGLTLQVISHCISGGVTPAFSSYMYDLPRAIDENRVAEISAAYQSFGYLLLTIVCLSVMYKLIEQMGKFAGEIAGAAGFSPATEAVAPFARGAVKEARKGAEWAGETTSTLAKDIGHGLGRATRLDRLYRWSGRNASKVRGILTGTGRYGYRAWWRRGRW